jgi:hypothetical protein
MRLVTVATHSDLYFPYLKKSCLKYNSDITVLGWGQPWPGYSFKYKLMKEYLINVSDDDIVCFIDSFDVLLLRPIDELESFFRNYSELTGVKIIVAFDIKPSTIVSTINHYQFGTCHGLSLNSGTYIGFAKEIKHILNEIYSDPSLDDQLLLTDYVYKYPHKVHIDTSSLFFLTINNPTGEFMYDTHIKVENDMLYYRGIRPFFAHGNGNTNMIRLIKELGYKMSNKVVDSILSKSKNAQFKKVVNYYYPQLILLVILLILIFWFIYRYVKKSSSTKLISIEETNFSHTLEIEPKM